MIKRILRYPVIWEIARNSLSVHTTSILRLMKKEVIRNIDPFSHINVNLKKVCRVKILPYDLLDSPDGNILRATVITNSPDENSEINILIQDNKVSVHNEDSRASEVTLEIPVKADLSIETDGALELADLHSNIITVNALDGISTRNLRSEEIQLHSECGDIVCQGTTLGYRVQIKTENSGNISLDKVLGEELQVDTDNGSISTKSCYSTNSKFITNSGNLCLNNVHRTTEVNIVNQGNLNMCGFNGTLLAKVHRGNVRLHLAELWGENVVITNESKDVAVNISDSVIDSTYIHAAAINVHVDESMKHLRGEKETGATTLGQKNLLNKLFIQTKGRLEIKRLSWEDAMKLKM